MEHSASISKSLEFSEQPMTLQDESTLIIPNISNYSSNNTELTAQKTQIFSSTTERSQNYTKFVTTIITVFILELQTNQ
jgi:hypothetical protein